MEKVLEFGKRAVSLWFAAYYGRTHNFPRDTTIRVAGLAYRFMQGEPTEVINHDADAANEARETRQQKVAVNWPYFHKKAPEEPEQ